jgi:hypothetical protein
MAAVDMRRVNIWLPADLCPNNTQYTASNKHQHGSAPAAATSRSQAAPLNKKAGPRPQHSGKPNKSAAVTQRHEFLTRSEDGSVKA